MRLFLGLVTDDQNSTQDAQTKRERKRGTNVFLFFLFLGVWLCVCWFAHRLSGLVASQDPKAEACVLPPQEDVLLLEVWNCRSNQGRATLEMMSSF